LFDVTGLFLNRCMLFVVQLFPWPEIVASSCQFSEWVQAAPTLRGPSRASRHVRQAAFETCFHAKHTPRTESQLVEIAPRDVTKRTDELN